MDGMAMMFKSLGIDVPKITKDFEDLKSAVTKTLETIEGRLARIEQMQGDIWQSLQKQNDIPQRPQLPVQPQPQPQPMVHS